MVWRIDDPQGNEAQKIMWELVKYTRGRVLDIGCGNFKAFPHFIGLDNGTDIVKFGHQMKPDIMIDDATDLRLFNSEAYDAVFSSHLLEHIPQENVVKALKEWLRVLKVGGYLCLYLPDETLYPKVGEPGANPDHKWNVSYKLMIELMEKAGCWDLVDWQRRDQDNEYSLFFAFKKTHKGHTFSCSNPKPSKTAAIVRYGAYGDLLQMSSVAAGLKAEGYHVTLYGSPPGVDVILHDPNIDEFYLQDKDQVPNHALAPYWEYHRKKYDRWVNLSESVEGQLLALPGRSNHELPPALREEMMHHNYLEFQHRMAKLPHVPRVKYFSTPDEQAWAKAERAKMGEFVIVWSLAGSSVHKVWPYVDQVIMGLLLEFTDVHVVLVGGDAAVLLEQGWFHVNEDGTPKRDERKRKLQTDRRVHCLSGDWSIRETMAFCEQVDMVVGPETGVLNGVAQLDMPKLVFLSHSTEYNLTRDWVNVYPMRAKGTVCPGRGNNEAKACHQLHYGWQHCKNALDAEGKPMGIAQCQAEITSEEVFGTIHGLISKALDAKKAAAA